MARVVIIADETADIGELHSGLVDRGFVCWIVPAENDAIEKAADLAPRLLLVHLQNTSAESGASDLPKRIRQEKRLPVIALVSHESLDGLDASLVADDFVVAPWDVTEVALRIERALRRTSGVGKGRLIECGDLTIDIDNCEVTIGGRPVALTFREYELLKFLASNKGRVFSREDLLRQVWGYDYFGGGRTVDVHVRRLRSKIEDSTHTFVETVRSVGYRFRRD